jgi:anti-sigma factor RsiW
MTCQDVRPLLFAFQRGQLGPERQDAVDAHIQGCTACAHEAAAEKLLNEALEHRLPQHAAPIALKRRLLAEWPTETSRAPSWLGRWRRSVVPALAVAAGLLVALPVYYQWEAGSRGGSQMVSEAVTDHLRMLASQHPLGIESGGMHQVKPWFQGRLDFAPVVPFLGDAEFPLRGGAVGYYLERKAAVFVFSRRLHEISLFVFRAAGLPWPTTERQAVGGVRATITASRGFNVILWQEGELGYALVSDVDVMELRQLAAKLAGGA